MKSINKIMLLVSLILLLRPSFASGESIRSGLFATEQDTSDLNRMVRVDSFSLPVIPPSSGVQFYRDKVLFLSLTKNERKMSPNHISFGSEEAYYAPVLDTVTGKHMVFSSLFPFSFPTEAVTFSSRYDTIYFTKLADNDKEKIFMAKYSDDGSQPGLSGGIAPMSFCSGNFNYSHPTLSADGKTMIFASDNKDSQGGMDLFVSRRKGKEWSQPENLGNSINTNGNEFFPFLDQDNNLYFSSDGLKGHGGYDIFTCKFNGKGWDKPLNLSSPINSKYDDIALTINKTDKKTAFFTRKSGKGEMQLFRIKVKHENRNLLTIFNGVPVPATMLAENEEKPKPAEIKTEEKAVPAEPEPLKKKTETTAGKKKTSVEQKTTIADAGKKPLTTQEKKPKNKAPLNPAKTTVAETSATQPGVKSVLIKPTLPIPDDQKDVVIYRVQILSSTKPRGDKEIVFNGKNYKLYEYFYLGAYRYTIGEFTTLQPAIDLQKLCRQKDFPQAFVAGFKNDTRSVDVKTFK